MRAAVLVLTALGVIACWALGLSWVGDAKDALAQLGPYRALIELDPTLAGGLADLEARLGAGRALLVGGVLGVVGGGLTVWGRSRLAALPLLVGGLAPLLFEPRAALFSALLALAGLLALLGHREGAELTTYRRADAAGPHA